MQRNSINGVLIISGTAAERATLAANIAGKGTEFWDIDTLGDRYLSDGTSWNLTHVGGAVLVADGISGIPDYRVTGAVTSNTRVPFPAGPTYVQVTPIGTGGIKVAMNAPDVTSLTTTATGAAWLAQADNANVNMMHRKINVADPVEIREFYDPDGIFCIDIVGDAGITSVRVMGV